MNTSEARSRPHRPKTMPHRQRGAVAPLVALLLPVLIASAAFAIDLAYVHVVRNEMQNDADAAALAGAHALVNASTGAVQWAAATAQAQQSVSLNRAAGQPLSDAQVQTGYWNLTGKPAGLQPQSLVPTVWDAPAVAVTVRKATGQNQGPVQTFFARFWNILGVDQQVTATAAPSSSRATTEATPWASLVAMSRMAETVSRSGPPCASIFSQSNSRKSRNFSETSTSDIRRLHWFAQALWCRWGRQVANYRSNGTPSAAHFSSSGEIVKSGLSLAEYFFRPARITGSPTRSAQNIGPPVCRGQP